MATLAQLQAAVTGLITAAGASGALQLNSNTRERAFEAYVFALLVEAARRSGANVLLIGIKTGPNPNPLVFRGSPGRLGSTGQDFVYARCALNGTEFEIHVDVEFRGSSGAVHEIDVSIVDASHADAVRQTPSLLPTTRHVRGAMECKFYDSTLGVALGRAFVGLVSDCGRLNTAGFVTNGSSAGLASFLTAKRNVETFFHVTPLSSAVEARVLNVVEHALRKWACVP
jgi:hypothetical protein